MSSAARDSITDSATQVEQTSSHIPPPVDAAKSAGLAEQFPRTSTFFYYGWVMLVVSTVLQVGTSPGQTFGVMPFNPHLQEAMGLSQSMLTGAYFLASLLAAIPMLFVGAAIDRWGLRSVGCIVLVMLAVACGVMSTAGSLPHLTFGFFLLRTFGQGSLTLVASISLAMWFSRRLGFASGITGLGMSLAMAFLPRLFLELIQAVGWRSAYLVLGGVTLTLLIPMLTIFRNRPEDIGQTLDGEDNTGTSQVAESKSTTNTTTAQASVQPPKAEQEIVFTLAGAMRTPAYWIATAMTAIWGMIGTAITFNLLPILTSKGITAEQAANTMIALGICSAVFQMIGGLMADRYALNRLLAASATLLFAGVVLLEYTQDIWMAYGYSLCFGGAQGILTAAGSTLWPRYFGRVHLGKIRSSVWTATVAGCSVGPFLMGVSSDYLGGYSASLYLFAGLLFAMVIACFFAVKPKTDER